MKKIITPLLLSLSVLMGGQAASADVKELTADMFYKWTGFDQNAIRGEQYEEVEFNIGNDVALEGGNVVCGDGSVSNWLYADLTGSSKLIIEGTAGLPLRVMMNRQEDNSLIEKNPAIGEDGTVEVDLTDLQYVHLNTIKINWGGGPGVVNSIKYEMPEDPLMVPKEVLKNEIATASLYNSIAYTEESYNALQNKIKDGEEALSAATSVEEIQDATKAIQDAVAALELAEGYADLTKDMFLTYASVEDPGEGTNPGEGCAYNIFTSTDLPYGNVNVSELLWADLTNYEKLVVTTKGETKPRFCLNRLEANGQQGATMEDSKMIDINPNNDFNWSTEAYETIGEDTYTIDLKKIVADYGFARLHCIKKQGWGPNVLVTGMFLYNDPTTTAVEAIEMVENNEIFNIFGQRVDESYRGIVIKNGKKFIQK